MDDKHVDESWKEAVSKEKSGESIIIGQSHDSTENPPINAQEGVPAEESVDGVPEVNFINYITSLAFQTMIFLGAMPNPVTGATEKNLIQAKFVIDTLDLLREKTKGNLDKQEEEALNTLLYELQMKYVELAGKEQS